MPAPILALTQGDPAGIGPEILLKVLTHPDRGADWQPLLIAERAALEAVRQVAGEVVWEHLAFLDSRPSRDDLHDLAPQIAVLDPVGEKRHVTPGDSGPADAGGAVAALNAGIELMISGHADGLVTGPVSKLSIARQHLRSFTGQTGYLASACGLERYGRDYLMAFLTEELQVGLLSTHVPLREALAGVTRESVCQALACLHRHAGGRIAVAGLNPHAGEAGLLGSEDSEIITPAVTAAQASGIDAHGPESPDSLFWRARRGVFDWVLALYHDQGLIAVKTAAFGAATNWTLGLPFLRTSVDHGTAFELAGSGRAQVEPLQRVVTTTCRLLRGELPRRRGG